MQRERAILGILGDPSAFAGSRGVMICFGFGFATSAQRSFGRPCEGKL